MSSLQYRRDLDGLRGIALIIGVLFHIFPHQTFPSGYAAAELFFVLSGFLISSIIYKKLEKDSFSFREFYSYSINRIFPALLMLLFTMLIVSWFTFFAHELRELGEHLASGGFLSNFVLATESGYFHIHNDFKPLIHIWSLAVEEQYYLLFPLLIWIIHRSGLNRERILILIILLSFSLNIYFVSTDPVGNYYYPHTRSWALFCGALLGSVLPRFQKSKWPWDAISVIALLTIILTAILTPVSLTYPGFWGILPTLATVALIAARPDSLVNRTVLSSSVLVFLGLISYPVYLWHWAIMSFGNIYNGGPVPLSFRFSCIVVSLLIGWLTYKFIELPNRIKGPGRYKPLFFLGAFAVIVFSGIYVYSTFGVPSRAIAQRGVAVTEAMNDWEEVGTTFVNGKIQFSPEHLFEGQTSQKVLFIGDSLMTQYYPRIKDLYQKVPKPKLSTIFAARDHCIPAPIPDLVDVQDNTNCIDFYSESMKLASSSDVHTVVFTGRWGEISDPSLLAKFFADVSSLVKSQKRVFILTPSPISRSIGPYAASKYFRFKEGSDVTEALPRKLLEDTTLLKKLADYSNASGAILVNPFDYVCFPEACPYIIKGRLLYKDEGHLRRQTVLRKWMPLSFIDQMIND